MTETTTTHRVTIYGPNLRDQRHGEFHVHAAGCADARSYGPGRKFGGDDDGWTIEVTSRRQVVEEVYGDVATDAGEWDSPEWEESLMGNASDVWFAPCVKHLPVR